jgi:DnaJ-domain-containing protein 1
MQSFYDRLGNILRDRLDSDEDPFETWEAHEGKTRQAGNSRERTPPPKLNKSRARISVPPELVSDFKVLGLLPGESMETCKAAWKRLLKKYHPDANAQNPEEQDRSTRLSSNINDSYRKITHWFETGVIK